MDTNFDGKQSVLGRLDNAISKLCARISLSNYILLTVYKRALCVLSATIPN